MKKKGGVLGSGVVGVTLANGLESIGFSVKVANRSGHKVDGWDGAVGTFEKVADWADLLVLCVKGSVAEELVKSIEDKLAGKTVIDTTNPLQDVPPADGVLYYFTTFDDSLMERMQRAAPEAHFVKAFNSTGNATMVNPKYKEGKPTMFMCGNDEAAKKEVKEILDKFGWEPEDLGKATAARAIEPLCMLWCVPGMLHNEWTHTFKLLRHV